MDNAVSMTFTNKVSGSNLTKYAEKLERLKKVMESMPKNVNISADLTKPLETTNKLLVNLKKNMSSFKRSTTSFLGNMKKPITDTSNAVQQLNNKINSTGKVSNKVAKVFSFNQLDSAFKSIINKADKFLTTMFKFTSKSADYVENLNLMNVAFHRTEDSISEANLEGIKFVNTLSDMYGLDESALTRTVGNFKQLANAMGMADELGTKLSKTLTQMAIDTSSLYNLSFERSTQVLQSALAGLIILVWLA